MTPLDLARPTRDHPHMSSAAVALDPSMRVVVLYGKERFLIEEHSRRFAEMLEKKFDGVERFTFDGETVQPATVLDELRSYGLMQKHKLVVLENADCFLAGGGKRKSEGEGDEPAEGGDGADETSSSAAGNVRRLMERYAETPVPDATLLMRAPIWRKGKLDNLIVKAGGTISEQELPTIEKAIGWAVQRCGKRYDATLDRAAAELLVSRLGPELQRLDSELLKLASMAGGASVGGGGRITRALVAENIGLSREEKAWEIQNALATGNAATMLRKLRELLDVSRQDAVPITWAICDFLRKVHAAAQLVRRGVLPRGAAAQAKMWGPWVEPALEIARRTEPADLAQLLQAAIETDQHNKSGVGEPQRSLEALLLRIADRVS